MAPWAQWFIDNNMRYLLYILALAYIPFSLVRYILIEIMPDLLSDIRRDLSLILTAKRTLKDK